MRWFKKFKANKKHQHNLKVSENIGMLLVDKFATDRTFRRTMESKFPNFCRQFDFYIQQIKE